MTMTITGQLSELKMLPPQWCSQIGNTIYGCWCDIGSVLFYCFIQGCMTDVCPTDDEIYAIVMSDTQVQ